MLFAGHYFLENVILLHKCTNFREVPATNGLRIAFNVAREVAILGVKKSVREYVEEAGLPGAARTHDGHELSGLDIPTAICHYALD